MVALAVAVVVASGWYWTNRRGGVAPASPLAIAAAEEGVIRIPLSELDTGEAKFLEHRPASGPSVRFFAVKSADGQYRAALDACEVCYHAGLGYQQVGNEMLCLKCRRSFPSELIDDASGGCHPISVARRIDGTDLVIQTATLEQTDARYRTSQSGQLPSESRNANQL